MESLFGPEPVLDADRALIAAYERAGRTLDDLPYTDQFERLYGEVAAERPGATRHEVFRQLHTLRKAARLPRLGRGASSPPAITREEEEELTRLVAAEVGSLGKRDQLPYDEERFGRVHAGFQAATGRALSPHDLWRLIAKLAK